MIPGTPPSHTLAQIQDWVGELTYKPGWKFVVLRNHAPFIGIGLSQRTEDSNEPGRFVTIGSTVVVPWHIDGQKDFLRWFARELIEREAHETIEWLRFGGERVFEPHPNGQTTTRAEYYRLASA